MEISMRHEVDLLVITVTGEMDAATTPRIESMTSGLAEDGSSKVAMDVERLTFIDSAGLVFLANLARRLGGSGHRLQLRNPSRRTRRLLAVTGVADFVEFEPPD
jgi:anti-sigma B factor antagonist